MAVNFSKNQDDITKAWRSIIESENVSNWALFSYEGSTNVINLMATGSKGLDELVGEFNCSLIQYAFCRVIDTQHGLNKLVLINWQGESAPLSRKGLCASHVGDVTNYFKGCTQTITIRNEDEATKEHLMEQILRTFSSRINLSRQQQPPSSSMSTSSVSTDFSGQDKDADNSYSLTTQQHTTNIGSDIAANRKSFWQRQEEEEKERLAEEKRRQAEKQAQFERERKQREEQEARKLAETIEQRDRLIDATRQADRKAANNSSTSGSTGGSSQPSSILSSSGPATSDVGDDDGRVGRRSELIRLERNQETQSIISKGLIKNKRAIFEQQAKQQQQNQPTTLSRRASGAMITQRLNAFKSLDVSNTSSSLEPTLTEATDNPSVSKIANGFAKKVSLGGDDNSDSNRITPIEKEVQSIKLTNDEDQNSSNLSYTNYTSKTNTENNDRQEDSQASVVDNGKHEAEVKTNSPKKFTATVLEQQQDTLKQDVNGNSKQLSPGKRQHVEETYNGASDQSGPVDNENSLITNGKLSEAVALYDYEAADNTEISFDPEDKIGSIQKVDPGWWQGKVMSGRYKGQVGLFPSNYVKEL